MPGNNSSRLFVLDTNVLMHNPAALFRFQEHDVFIPMVVLEELHASKKGMTEVARNTRQVSRFLDELINDEDSTAIEKGLVLNKIQFINGNTTPQGHLFLQTQQLADELPSSLPRKKPTTPSSVSHFLYVSSTLVK
jgi:PhoH-like ATPase